MGGRIEAVRQGVFARYGYSRSACRFAYAEPPSASGRAPSGFGFVLVAGFRDRVWPVPAIMAARRAGTSRRPANEWRAVNRNGSQHVGLSETCPESVSRTGLVPATPGGAPDLAGERGSGARCIRVEL